MPSAHRGAVAPSGPSRAKKRLAQDDNPRDGSEEDTMHDVAAHDDSKVQYFWVWGALLVLTAIEVVLAYKQVLSAIHMLEVLLILSVVKSALIIGYFMHLKFERALMRWLLIVSVTACFVIMYFFFFPDAGRILHLGVR
jgi:caa(3)-type oxidase subunit IV